MIVDGERKLVTARVISDIQPIPNADAIEVATVDGWEVVVKKGEFKIGDTCLYFEIDSLIPATGYFDFLAPRAKMYDGVLRARIKTIKLRGQISQGLVAPIRDFVASWDDIGSYDFDAVLNVIKYEPPQDGSGCAAGGTFPVFIPKTDEERCQNIFAKYKARHSDVVFQKSLKLDGSSITMAWITEPDWFLPNLGQDGEPYAHEYDDAQFIVASRNQTLRYNPESRWWMGVENTQVIERMKALGKSIAVQGELMGPGIQKNRENFTEYKIFAFRVWFIDEQRFGTDEEFHDICRTLGLEIVPQLGRCKPFEEFETVKDMLADADRPSINNKIAEGVVYKSVNLVNGQMIHFKAINNKFLLKYDE